MFQFVFYILSAALLLGLTLSLFYLGIVRVRLWWLAAVHGTLGAAGFGALIFAWNGRAQDVARGVEGFGKLAAILAGVTLAIGVTILLLPTFGHRRPNWVIGAHATMGIAAYVFLLAYVALG